MPGVEEREDRGRSGLSIKSEAQAEIRPQPGRQETEVRLFMVAQVAALALELTPLMLSGVQTTLDGAEPMPEQTPHSAQSELRRVLLGKMEQTPHCHLLVRAEQAELLARQAMAVQAATVEEGAAVVVAVLQQMAQATAVQAAMVVMGLFE